MGTKEHIKWRDLIDLSSWNEEILPEDFIQGCIKRYGRIDKIPFGYQDEDPPVFTNKNLVEYELDKFENSMVGQELLLQALELKNKGVISNIPIFSNSESEATSGKVYISLYNSGGVLFEIIGHEIAHFIEINKAPGMPFSSTHITTANFNELKEYVIYNEDKNEIKLVLEEYKEKFKKIHQHHTDEINNNFGKITSREELQEFANRLKKNNITPSEEFSIALKAPDLDLNKFCEACERFYDKIANISDQKAFEGICNDLISGWNDGKIIREINKNLLVSLSKCDSELYGALGNTDPKFRDAYYSTTRSFTSATIEKGYLLYEEDYAMDIQSLLGNNHVPYRISYNDLTGRSLNNDDKKIVYSDDPYPAEIDSKPAFVFDLSRNLNGLWENTLNYVPNPGVENGILNKDIELSVALREFENIFKDKILTSPELVEIENIQKTLKSFEITTKIDLENKEIRVVNYFRAEGFELSDDLIKK